MPKTSKSKNGNPKNRKSFASKLASESAAESNKKAAGHWLRETTSTKDHIDSLSTRVRTLDQLLAKAEVDLDAWEVERFVTNQWEVGARMPDGRVVVTPLFQVKAWLKKKTAWSVEEFRSKLLEEMRQAAPLIYRPAKAAKKPAKRSSSGLMYEVSVFDQHVGKLCWGAETGTNYDLKIARDTYMDAVEDLASRISGYQVDSILFPVGNDFLHTDNAAGTTTRGTPQDCDGRAQLQFMHARRMLVSAIDRLREIAPVQIVVVPGNHDRERMFYIGDTIESWYRLDKRTNIDNTPRLRKYMAHGIVLLGFTHGSEEKHAELPRLMADEVPELWAKSKHREIHLGHRHIKKETQWVTTDTHGKTVVRILPSLSGVDAWHYSKGYSSPRCSEAYLWSAESGYLAHFSHSLKAAA